MVCRREQSDGYKFVSMNNSHFQTPDSRVAKTKTQHYFFKNISPGTNLYPLCKTPIEFSRCRRLVCHPYNNQFAFTATTVMLLKTLAYEFSGGDNKNGDDEFIEWFLWFKEFTFPLCFVLRAIPSTLENLVCAVSPKPLRVLSNKLPDGS